MKKIIATCPCCGEERMVSHDTKMEKDGIHSIDPCKRCDDGTDGGYDGCDCPW